MGRVIGIDLGTTNSCVAVLRDGQSEILESAEGGRTTPSVVAFTDSERLVGAVAKRQAVANPARTVSSIKRFMGRTMSEVPREAEIVPYTLEGDDQDRVRVRIGDDLYAPEEISAMIIRKLCQDAESKLGEEIEAAVVTVPAYFNDKQRQATADAVRIAGIRLERIINEPTAAALAYGLDREADERVLVFDLGGGTFDVSVLEISDGVFEVLATSGDNHLGGDNWDAALVDWLLSQAAADGVDLREKTLLQRLYEAAERAKIELSSSMETRISLPFIAEDNGEPYHLERVLPRSEFLQITQELFHRIAPPLRQAIDDAGGSIDHVVLVGGMTRIPAIQELVEQISGVSPYRGVNPDEVVAAGAAAQAGALAGDLGDLLLLDVTPLSLGLETRGGVMTVLLRRNTTIPTRRTEIFSTSEDNQPSVEIHVLQGERPMAADNKSLGRFSLTDIPPARRGTPQIEVTFDIDVDGILQVSAKDETTGQEQAIEIRDGSGLPEEEITKMLRSAEASADLDRQRRELAEAENARETAIYLAEQRLAENPDVAGAHSVIEKINQLRSLQSSNPGEIRIATQELQDLFGDIFSELNRRARGAQRSHHEVVDAEVLDED